MIERKPVPRRSPIIIEQKVAQECINEVCPACEIDPPPYDSDTEDSLLDCYLLPDVEDPPKHFDGVKQLDHLELQVVPASNVTSAAIADVPETKSTRVKHAFGTAFSEAKYFAGGLLSHPHESTRHYTILRHSFGLVYYHGPSTNVTLTIFSDRPLPEDRTLWMQKRGFSGKTGLAVGAALGTRNAWIDVTPSIHRTPDQLPKDQERAWQRDISNFAKKTQDLKHISDHIPRETAIIAIPHVAEDGYFRVVLCSGRKTLCCSPTFRYASTSADPGMLRGASLLTLPLEVGLKVGARAASTAANAASHHTLRPVTAVAQTVSKKVDWAPMHWVGIRGVSAGLTGHIGENGGVSVKRR